MSDTTHPEAAAAILARYSRTIDLPEFNRGYGHVVTAHPKVSHIGYRVPVGLALDSVRHLAEQEREAFHREHGTPGINCERVIIFGESPDDVCVYDGPVGFHEKVHALIHPCQHFLARHVYTEANAPIDTAALIAEQMLAVGR